MLEDGVWRTISGRKVFIKKGQSLTDAMKESKKFKEKNVKEILKKQFNKKLKNSIEIDDIAYHASNKDFDEFDTSKIGTGQGDNTQGNGINLASDDSVHGVYGNILYKVKVNLKNAYVAENKKLLSTFEKDFGYKTDMDNVSKELSKMGYDGIVLKINNNKLYTVFDNKNVKIISKKKESR